MNKKKVEKKSGIQVSLPELKELQAYKNQYKHFMQRLGAAQYQVWVDSKKVDQVREQLNTALLRIEKLYGKGEIDIETGIITTKEMQKDGSTDKKD